MQHLRRVGGRRKGGCNDEYEPRHHGVAGVYENEHRRPLWTALSFAVRFLLSPFAVPPPPKLTATAAGHRGSVRD